MTLPPVTVVVASYGKVATLRACLDAALGADYPDLDVIVVDSGSTDGTLELLASHYPRVRVAVLPGSSLPAALNHGFRLAAGRDVVRLHGDVAPQGRDWLRRLAAVAASAPDIGIVGVRLVHANGRIQSVGRDIVTGFGLDHQNSDRRLFEHDSGRGGAPQQVDSVRGACALYRRAVLDAVQLDENYAPAHGDDDDFCLAARWHGFSVWVAPDVAAVHYTPHRSRMTPMSLIDRPEQLEAALGCQDACRAQFTDYFERKWGFAPRSPDVNEIRRLYGHTAICWRIGEPLRWRGDEERPAVDVAFLTFNSVHLLPRMLAALRATRWERLTVWAVDNGSTDGTLELLHATARDFPFAFHVHQLPTNVGVVPALNLAFSLGNASLLARLDDDTIVAPDWLERMVPRFRQRPFAGVIGPLVLQDNGSDCIQGHPFRAWPNEIPVGDRVDRGQFAGLVRTTSVRGCCNLYRRDVLARVGLLDLRYAPSQFDECDHHIAMVAHGYEVLHDGSTAVRHVLGQGRTQTHAGMSSAQGNQSKLFGKWGHDVFTRLDRGIDLSREGRVLPADGDTSAYLATLPPPASPVVGSEPLPSPEAARRLLRRRVSFEPNGAFAGLLAALLQKAEEALQAGNLDVSGSLAWLLGDAFPHVPQVLSLLARRAAAEGDVAIARRLFANALALAPDDATLRAQIAALAAPIAVRIDEVMPGGAVAVLPPFGLADDEGGPLAQLHAEAYVARGLPSRVLTALGPSLHGAAAVHAFDLGGAVRLLDQVKAARVATPWLPLRLTPWQCAPGPAAWAAHVLPAVFHQAQGADELAQLLALATAGKLAIDGSTERTRATGEPEWLLRYQREVLACVDELLLHDASELEHLRARFRELPPHRFVAWPDPGRDLLPDGGAAFVAAHGLRDFVLLPGPVTPAHNQLVALHALSDLPCVVLGPYPDAAYELLCRKFAGERTHFLPALSPELLHSALQAARLVAFPTFRDRLTAPLARARAVGTPVLCSSGSALARGLGQLARPVDPCDVPAMRAIAEAVFATKTSSAPRFATSAR